MRCRRNLNGDQDFVARTRHGMVSMSAPVEFGQRLRDCRANFSYPSGRNHGRSGGNIATTVTLLCVSACNSSHGRARVKWRGREDQNVKFQGRLN